MTPDQARWSRIHSLFNQVVDLPPPDREAFLDETCADDAELRQELVDLLNADTAPSETTQSGLRASVLTQALGVSMERMQTDRRSRWVGQIVGAYRILEVLGHGGGSTVYLAERADRQYESQVAIKLFEQTFHDKALRNFRAERQILANLNHPNIAKLFDAGETPDGHPFLVMEHVKGERIDHYCDRSRLSVKQRLQLFVKVCEVVQYAHQNLVVHRDLKPANILITESGEPKLLDFGIAKLLDQAHLSPKPAQSQPITQIHERILTPEYASPEQFRGQLITTASDVYALGVVLYELLCSVRPYQVNVVSQLELDRIICMTDPPWPSQMVQRLAVASGTQTDVQQVAAARRSTVSRLPRELRGDVDAIVMRSIRKEANRRYFSVEQFSDDIKRHLRSEPIVAYQGNWAYYAWRFFMRHRVLVGSFVGVSLLLIITSIVLFFQSKVIERQRDAARIESDRAESVSRFMMEIFSSSDPFETYGREVMSQDLLDQARKRIQNDTTTEDAVRARLLYSVGSAYRRQGIYEPAVDELQQAVDLMLRMQNPSLKLLERSKIELAQAKAGLQEQQAAAEQAKKKK